MSAGRLVALALGLSAPLAFWAASSLMSADWAWARSAGEVSSATAAVPSVNAKPQLSLSSIPTDDSSPEGRLLEIYRLIGEGDMREALQRAQKLSEAVPNFHLAQLVYGDLLLAQTSNISALGNVPGPMVVKAPEKLAQLRNGGRAPDRAALQERPPVGALPSQFINLPPSTKHAIAVDASKSRLYVFENRANGLQLVADHYASIGKLGAEKSVPG